MYFNEIASASEQTPYCGVHASFKITLSCQRTWHVNECYFRLTFAFNLLSLSYLFSGECAGDSFRSWIFKKNHSFIHLFNVFYDICTEQWDLHCARSKWAFHTQRDGKSLVFINFRRDYRLIKSGLRDFLTISVDRKQKIRDYSSPVSNIVRITRRSDVLWICCRRLMWSREFSGYFLAVFDSWRHLRHKIRNFCT